MRIIKKNKILKIILKKTRGQKIDVSDPFDSFSRKKEFFLLNNVRGVDLTKEE